MPISDLHFGARDHQTAWSSLAEHLCQEIKPELVLVSGDLVDTPKRSYFQSVAAALENLNSRLGGNANDKKYVVCPGNHDRHKQGNAWPWRWPYYLFEQSFAVPTLDKPYDLWLGVKPNRWRVRILSVDTSISARYSAQAFLNESVLGSMRSLYQYDQRLIDAGDPAAIEQIPYLVILLLHHHLLPLPASEKARQSWTDIFRFTSAVNPGTILENLAESQVDLVLHGHEHHQNMARYGSYSGQTGQVALLAAGSGTGMKTLEGCDPKRASFNLLELKPDRSVLTTEVRGPGAGAVGWSQIAGTTTELVDSTTLRHNRFRRLARIWRRGVGTHAGEWEKHVIFTEGRDAIVREKRRNWLISGNEFSFRIQNDTGQPASPEAHLDLRDPAVPWSPADLAPIAGDRGAFAFRVVLQNVNTHVIANLIETTYQWLGAVLLNTADFGLINVDQADEHRCDRREFVAASVPAPIRNLTLTVTLPVGFYPPEGDVGAYHKEVGAAGEPEFNEALTSRLQFTGQTIVLTIPYPLLNYRYSIAWKPVAPVALSSSGTQFRKNLSNNGLGDKLATSCLDGFRSSPWQDLATCAIYIPDGASGNPLRRVGLARGSKIDADLERPQTTLDLRERALFRRAWWNQTALAMAEPDDSLADRQREGMLEGEKIAATVPLRVVDIDREPWAIARVGVLEAAPGSEESFRQTLARGQLQALYRMMTI